MKTLFARSLLALAMTAPAHAQWTADPALNQVISGAASDQNQVKVSAAPDGGFWVSWLDGIATGWDVRLQKLDASGREVFPPGGLLIADRGFSSTQDYGLSVASDGDALLAFRDDRTGSTTVTAMRVTGAGDFEWGPDGVSLIQSPSSFVAAPKIAQGAASSVDRVVVAWTENSGVVMQSLDAGGAPTWSSAAGTGNFVVISPPFGSYVLADLQGVGDEAIVSIVHQTGGFTAPRHLVAQRLSVDGALLWGATPVTVFNAGSLQIGNFPRFTLGGEDAVFSWYSSSPALQCFVQRLDRAGVPRWTPNGVPVATAPGALRVNPRAAFHGPSGDVFVTWKDLNSSQSQSGVSAQRIDASGARLWSSGGVSVVPIGATGADFPIPFPVASVGASSGGSDVLIAWSEDPSFGSDRIYGIGLDAGGAIGAPRFDVASTPSGKARLDGAVGVTGVGVLGWSDARNDGGDILVQALDLQGGLGAPGLLLDTQCPGVPNSTGAGGTLIAFGSDVATDNHVTLLASNLPVGAFGFFITSTASGAAPNPGGSDGVLCLGGSIGRLVGPGQVVNSGPAGVFSLTLDLAQQPTPTGFVSVLGGETWFFQAWHRDVNVAVTSNFTAALQVDFL